MTAFATHTELGTRLGRTFTAEEQTWVTALLEDAAEYMRGIIGEQVYPPQEITFTAWPDCGRVDLPAAAVQSIGSVTSGGKPVRFTRVLAHIIVESAGPVDVTFTPGYATAPRDLVALNCAMVSSQILLVEAGLGLQVGGLSSVALDDFKVAFADAGEQTGLSLPAMQCEYLRNRYGSSVYTTGG